MSDQKGLSLIDFLIVGVLLGGVYFIYRSNTTQQEALAENMRFRLEVYNMRQITQSILSDPNNCTASIQSAFPTPPDFMVSTDLPTIRMGNFHKEGQWASEPFYVAGKDYHGIVKLTDILVRPFDEKVDFSPGHKLELRFKSLVEKSVKTYARTFNFSFDQRPLPLFPEYPFRCSLTPVISPTQDLADVEQRSLACNEVSIKLTAVSCPAGKKPVSCGVEFVSGDLVRDRVFCHTNQTTNGCTFTHDSAGNCDIVHGHCYCL
jgi:hypothetical protein